MSPTRKALGTVRLELPPRFTFAMLKREKDGSATCRIHGTAISAPRKFAGIKRRLWSRCPDCYPFSARRLYHWRDTIWS